MLHSEEQAALRDSSQLVNPLLLAKPSQTDEHDLSSHLCLYGFSGEADFPANPRPVVHIKLTEGVELQSESVRPQMVKQCSFHTPDHHVDYVLSFFLGL